MTTPTTPPVGPDWQQLRAHAVALAARAYVPYSHYPVGAAALVDDGRVIGGCNVENAGYGVTLCAECGLVSDLVAGGGGRLLAFVCVNGAGDLITPCGRCRQLLWEHGGAALQVWSPNGVIGMAELLPQAFGPDALAALPHDEQPHDEQPADAQPVDAQPVDPLASR